MLCRGQHITSPHFADGKESFEMRVADADTWNELNFISTQRKKIDTPQDKAVGLGFCISVCGQHRQDVRMGVPNVRRRFSRNWAPFVVVSL